MTVNITIFRRKFLLGYSYNINCNGVKKIVGATKNDSNFNRFCCRLYRNEPRLSVSQVFVTETVIFLHVHLRRRGALAKRVIKKF